jgi:hypothetical protein
MEKNRIRDREKHPGSATMISSVLCCDLFYYLSLKSGFRLWIRINLSAVRIGISIRNADPDTGGQKYPEKI